MADGNDMTCKGGSCTKSTFAFSGGENGNMSTKLAHIVSKEVGYEAPAVQIGRSF